MAYQLATPGEPPEYPSVFSFIRDDVLIVRSLLADGPPRIFMNALGELDETANERAWRVDRQCLAALRELQFEYLVFLNRAMPVVAVVQMARRSEHRYVILHPLQPPSPEGKALMPMSVQPPITSLMGATSDLVDAQRPKPGATLGANVARRAARNPCFDIRHVGFEVEFFGDDQEDIRLPEYTIASYEAAKDTAPDLSRALITLASGLHMC